METQNDEVLKITDNLRKIIVDKGITQAAMASFMETDASQCSKILKGETRLRVDHLANIARCLNMSIIDIITYPEKYVSSKQVDNPIKASVTIQLSPEKRDKVLQMIFDREDLDFLK